MNDLTKIIFLTLCLGLTTASAATARERSQELLIQAMEVQRKGLVGSAQELMTKATEADPTNPAAWLQRGLLHRLKSEHAEAIKNFDKVVMLDPKSINGWEWRGEERYKLGRVEEALADFDKVLELQPQMKPQHWQRGIALYDAGRFKEGREQFESHQNVNRNDVENAVWHFLCVARVDGVESARRALIPIQGDGRVPMAQVHNLFAGKGTAQEVIDASQKTGTTDEVRKDRLFYAYLYLGLYYEATGEKARALDYLKKSTTDYAQDHYMGDVARVRFQKLSAPK